MRSTMSGWSARRFTPKGRSVRLRTSLIAARSSSRSITAAARIPNPPALAVAAVSSGPDTHPMPVCTIGYSMPTRSHRAE